jgi:hypothetical protein
MLVDAFAIPQEWERILGEPAGQYCGSVLGARALLQVWYLYQESLEAT